MIQFVYQNFTVIRKVYKMLNIIIGKSSNLSQRLKSSLVNVVLVSSNIIEDSLNEIDFDKYQTINIIFNQFQISSELYNLSNPKEYVYRCIGSTSIVLEYIKKKKIKINKILYTSSGSVYGNKIETSENSIPEPISLHSSLKVANEKLIELFCSENVIDYSIVRIFNMYGGRDNFSVISKIINAYKTNKILSLTNNGQAIRDYIHIDDVVYCYSEILKVKNIPIINIGTGKGISLLYLLDFLRKNNINIEIKNIIRKELNVSICKNDILYEIIGKYSFKKVEDYILLKLKNKTIKRARDSTTDTKL